MAVAYSDIDVETEGAPTGAAAAASLRVLATEWGAEERFAEVSGYTFALIRAIDAAAIKIEAMTEATADHMYAGVFDMESLVKSDFNPALDFDQCVKVIGFALKREMSMTATVKPVSVDAVDLVISAPLACFEAVYKLRLFRAEVDATHVLSAKLRESQAECESTRLQLAAARNENDSLKETVDTLKETIETMEAKMEEEITGRHSAEERLAKATSQIDELKKALAASKAESEKLAAELRAEIRIRDARIGQLEKSRSLTAAKKLAIAAEFRFDATLESGKTRPQRFELSADGKSATAKFEGQIALAPAITTDSEVTFIVEKSSGYFEVGEDCSKWMKSGCLFRSNGTVKVKDSIVAYSQAFGGWKQGDRLRLQLDLSRGTVSIDAPNGTYTVEWTPKSRGTSPVWFGLYSEDSGNKITIE